jgi:hypothetical protein
MKQIHKEYDRPFALEPTKLTRLMDNLHERLRDHGNAQPQDRFKIFLSGNRQEELDSLDAVLALENSRKQKIQRLLITSSVGAEGASRPEHEIQVDFAGNATDPNKRTKNVKVVAVSVRSNLAGWASRTLSEVEEQVERTWQRHFQSTFMLVTLLICVFIVLISQFVSFNSRNLAQQQWLSGADLDRLEQILDQNRTMTDEEVREIETREFKNILEDQRPKQLPQKGRTRQIIFIGIPFLTVIGCGFTLLLTCYPKTVFLWGDETERYASMLQRRNRLWTIIIGVMVIGVASKFFSASLDSLLPP